MKKLILFILFLLPVALFGQETIVARREGGDTEILKHPGFTACYNSATQQPDWVSWEITPETVVYDGNVSRCDEFLPDPLASRPTATTFSYSRTGYDRGHMAPAADFRYDQTAQDETFFLSNICLQEHNLNEKTWFELEKRCRFWCKNFYKTPLLLAAGPFFDEDPARVGRDALPVPSGFWKVVCKFDRGNWEAVGFVFPNEALDDDFRNYAVSVDEVERLTGLDFYPTLDGKLDESSFDLGRWK